VRSILRGCERARELRTSRSSCISFASCRCVCQIGQIHLLLSVAPILFLRRIGGNFHSFLKRGCHFPKESPIKIFWKAVFPYPQNESDSIQLRPSIRSRRRISLEPVRGWQMRRMYTKSGAFGNQKSQTPDNFAWPTCREIKETRLKSLL
jgi:hypothetical protein